MKLAGTAAEIAAGIALIGLAACSSSSSQPRGVAAPGAHPATASPSATRVAAPTSSPTPTITKTIVKYRTAPTTVPPVPPAQAPPAQPPASAPPAQAPPAVVPNVTDPWAVVSAYYGDIESGDYPQAWSLLDSGMTTGQTYQQFVDGFACTGAQTLTDLGESGDQVSFDLAATDSCTGAVQDFTGTDTVVGGKIVAASVTQTS